MQLSSSVLQRMSLNIDTKMIGSSKSSGWMFLSSRSFWISCRKSLEKSLESNCFSINSHSFLIWWIHPEIFNLAFPSSACDSWLLFHPTNTCNKISVDTSFCIRPFGGLIVDQCCPWWWWLFQVSHIQNFLIFFYSFLSDTEHTLHVLEHCVLADFQIH